MWKSIDRYENYLTTGDLFKQSGLTPEQLESLETARLLLPDTKDGRYRPKLAGWGKKIAYLLREGWTVDEVKRWSKERWKTDNPREWPPIRIEWH